MKDSLRSAFGRSLTRRLRPESSAPRKAKARVIVISLFVCSLFLLVPTLFLSSGAVQGQKGGIGGAQKPPQTQNYEVYSSQASWFRETPALRDLKPEPLSQEALEKMAKV